MDGGAREMTRRECMRWIGRAAVVGCGVSLCADAGDKDKKKSGSNAVSIVNLMSLRNGSALEVEKSEFILTRTDKGIAALSVWCTHRRNRLQVENGIISCPVHGSEFDLDGKPLNGPANRPLTWLATSVDEDGNIKVDPSKQVGEGNWAALPAWAQPKK